MRDKDTKILEERYESLYAGKIEEEGDTSLGSDEDKEDKEDKDSDKDSDKEESKEKESDSDESDSDSDSEDKDEHEDSESDDEESDEKGGEKSEGGDSGIQSKVKQLQKQYNDLLVDAFEKYAAECIENALDGVESSFGENITDILDGALQELKGKILGDLGVEDTGMGMGGDMGDMGDGDMGDGGMDGMEVDLGNEPEVTFGSKVGGVPTVSDNEDGESNDDGDDGDDDKKGNPFESKKHKKTDKIITESKQVASYYGFE